MKSNLPAGLSFVLLLFIFPFLSILRKTLKEIITQQIADFEQHVGVNPVAAKDFVDVLP